MAAFKRRQIHVSLGNRESGWHHIFFCSSIGDFRLLLPGAAFTIGAYSLKGSGRRHLHQLFGCLGRQQVLRGETNNKKSLAVFFLPAEMRQDGCRLHPTLKKYNVVQICWFCGASPPDPTHQSSASPDWLERRRTLLPLARTSALTCLVGGRSELRVSEPSAESTSPRIFYSIY